METILLIYNDTHFAEHLKQYLDTTGYHVRILGDAERIEEYLTQYKPDVIVVDALLQKMNGFELCAALKNQPQFRSIPIIMTSAIYIADEDIKQGLHFGETTYRIQADRCVMKPFEPPILLKHINEVLGKETATSSIPSILIVDDDLTIQDLLKTMLEKHRCHTMAVSTGRACLELVSTTAPDLIILDYKLPDFSGLTVLQKLRERLPEVAIILMTAYGDEDIAANAIEKHVEAYVRKPFLIESMLTLIVQIIKRTRIKRERKQLMAQLRESNRELMHHYEMLELANRGLRELDKLKSEFLANIGHELRTPLNSIIGFTELVLQGYSGTINADQSRQLSTVLNSATHLSKVVNDVIAIAMLNAGQIPVKYEVVQMSDVIDETVHDLRENAEKKRQKVLVNSDQTLPKCVCYREKIRLVVYNLLDNAIKFSSAGEIIISACAADKKAEDIVWWGRNASQHITLTQEYLLISIQDQGIGISQENFPVLFNEFRQVDGSLTREHNGTGLGLAISKKIVEIYGGEIWFESQLGISTTFYFTVPFSQQEE